MVDLTEQNGWRHAANCATNVAAYATAAQAQRPFRYLSSSQISKEEIARQDGVTSGLIAIFSALENCLSYPIQIGPGFIIATTLWNRITCRRTYGATDRKS